MKHSILSLYCFQKAKSRPDDVFGYIKVEDHRGPEDLAYE